MKLLGVLLFVGTSIILLSGCGSNQVLLKTNELEKKQTVNLTMRTGEKVAGEIIAVDKETITIVDKNGKAWRAKKVDITNAVGPIPVYDVNENIVSEKEIARIQTSNNRLLFAVSGGLLCAGASFFASSMLSRGAEGESQDGITYAGTAAGTALGSFLFYKTGAKKDRQKAIAQVSGSLEDPKMRAAKIKRTKVQAELDRLKKEREQQDKELKELQEKIKQKNP